MIYGIYKPRETIIQQVSCQYCSCGFFIYKNLKGALIVNEKAKEKRNEYLREWRKKNKEKVKRYNKKYWERKAEGE